MDRNKILVAQFYTSNVEYGPYAEAINKKYCEEKGYQYYCEKDTDKIIQKLKERSATWYKPILVKEILLTHNPEYILFLDIDAIVSDFARNIEDFINEKYDLTFAKDIGHHSLANAGVFILKNTEWAKDFLDLWYYSAEIYKGKDCPEIDKPE
jgi:hypothetical protein